MIAFIGDEPVASGLLFVSGETTWLGAGSTIKEYRNNGRQTAIIRARLNEGYKQGARRFSVESGQPEPGKENETASFTNLKKPVLVKFSTVTIMHFPSDDAQPS